MILKFRTWNKETKKIISHEKLKNISIFALKEELAQDNLFVLPMMDKYEIMQFTGLKDKYSIEIYEGDIVINEKVFDGARVIIFNKLMHISTQDNNGNDYMISMLDLPTIEVIGNIHENPELLMENTKL